MYLSKEQKQIEQERRKNWVEYIPKRNWMKQHNYLNFKFLNLNRKMHKIISWNYGTHYTFDGIKKIMRIELWNREFFVPQNKIKTMKGRADVLVIKK